jgi:hypothetical protein
MSTDEGLALALPTKWPLWIVSDWNASPGPYSMNAARMDNS